MPPVTPNLPQTSFPPHNRPPPSHLGPPPGHLGPPPGHMGPPPGHIGHGSSGPPQGGNHGGWNQNYDRNRREDDNFGRRGHNTWGGGRGGGGRGGRM